jgi:hypothetical protein
VPLENLPRRVARATPIDASPDCSGGVGQKEIALDRQLADERQFLEDAGHAKADRFVRVARLERFAAERHDSAVWRDSAANDLYQSRFPGAVLAGEAKDRTRRGVERGRLYRAGGAKGLFDGGH